MHLKSLGYKTDLFFVSFDGEIIDRGHYLVMRSTNSPNFHWGNLLLFTEAPKLGEHQLWQQLFQREFQDLPEVRHCTFGWDCPNGNSGEIMGFREQGFALVESIVLSTRLLERPLRYNGQLEVRPLTQGWEWEAALHNQIECREPGHSLNRYRKFRRQQMQRYHSMQLAGLGAWYGAFFEEKLVGDLGIFGQDQLGRYQNVGTDPAYRNRGVCATLVYEAGRYAMEHNNFEQLVMAADPDYHAARIYQSVGFQIIQKQVGVCRPPSSN